MIVGTPYTVTAGNTNCTSAPSAEFSNAATLGSPTFTVCIVQPTLCSKGSLTINATGGSDFLYSIDGSDPSVTTNVFSNLGAESVTSIRVKNSFGCYAAPGSCNIVSVCSAPAARPQTSTKAIVKTDITEKQTTVKAYPNPFNDKVKFVVTATKTGSGTLEVFNMLGQKVKTVYQGLVPAGVNNFELNLPIQKQSNLIYRFTMGEKQLTGKLIQLKQ